MGVDLNDSCLFLEQEIIPWEDPQEIRGGNLVDDLEMVANPPSTLFVISFPSAEGYVVWLFSRNYENFI